MYRLVPSLIILAAATPVAAQEAEVEVPPVSRPNFSQVVGDKYEMSSTAAPTEVYIEEPITLKVRISGQALQKYRPERINLRVFPEDVAEDFHVESVGGQDTLEPDKGQWEFVYRLRPKHEKVTRIPALQLLYYAPGLKKFQSAYTEEIPIKVKRRQEATAEKLNLQVVPPPA
ncbi:MAG TPA: BatD family protein, partial [Gemmataceae bacterium]|nr:BatD family protein [Gemmataceae bacterium]